MFCVLSVSLFFSEMMGDVLRAVLYLDYSQLLHVMVAASFPTQSKNIIFLLD